VKCGAFDFEGTPRWQLFHGIDAAFAAGQSAQADRASGQASLFGALPAVEVKPRYPKAGDVVGDLTVEEWPERVRLGFEKDALGFYITGHPLQAHANEAKRYASATCASIASKRNGDKVTVVGVRASHRERVNKETGARFAFLVLEDLTGTVDVQCWASKPPKPGRPGQPLRPAQKGWSDWEALCLSDEPILVHAEVKLDNFDEENPKVVLTATEIEPLTAVRNQKTTEVLFRIDADALTGERATSLKALLARFPGGTAASVRAVIPGESETSITVPSKVQPADDLLEAARRLGFEVELR
jgi:DNA polymerase-3 subunit alpha